MLPVGKDTNVAFGGKNGSVRVQRELFIQMCAISVSWCSVCFTREMNLLCACSTCSAGWAAWPWPLCFWAWVRVEMVHSAAANQVSWASELPWETEKLLRNRSKKKFGLDFFPPRNIPSVAELNYCAKSEMQSLQQHAHVAWKISWDSFFLGIQHTACCHYCFVSSGAPKTSYTNAILCQSSVILGQ